METRIVHQADLATYERIETKYFSIGYYSQKHPTKSGPNEDSLGFIVDGKHCFLAVADGVGGSPNGEVASHLTVNNALNALKKLEKLPHNLSLLREPVLHAIEWTNQKLIHDYVGARTTFTGCLLIQELLQSIHIGDSCLIVCGQKGLLKYKTLEHSPVGFAKAAELLSEKEAFFHPKRHIVSNVVGDPKMHMDIGPQLILANHDTLLLGSDGLFDNFRINILIEIIRKESIAEVLNKLTELCQPMRDDTKTEAFQKLDDISFIVCRQQ